MTAARREQLEIVFDSDGTTDLQVLEAISLVASPCFLRGLTAVVR
jgi:hypothetical protein